MAKYGKKLAKAYEAIGSETFYPIDEALALIRSKEAAKFDETLEIAMNLGVDPRHSDQMVRGMTGLPNGTGKEIRVAVFAKGDKEKEAKDAGADIVGEDELIDQVVAGNINFDRVIATPDMMPKIGKIAKILGPKGLMPNPKLGTVTQDVAKAVKDAKAGQVEYRVEKNGIVHAGVGKLSFDDKKLKENIIAFVSAVQQAKPSGAKGTYIERISLSSTMGPGVGIDVASALEQVANAA